MTTEEDAISNKNDNATQTNTTDSNTIAVDNQYFYEDLVYKITDKKVCFGMVVDNYEDNESDSDDSDSDCPPLSKGTIKVSWYPHGFEQIVKERAVGLADRSLMPGDVVRKLVATKASDSQHGYCREITVYADVQQVKTKYVLSSVPNTRLIPLDRYELDLVACLGPWVGSVKEHRTQLKVALMSCNPLSPLASVIARFELSHGNVCNLKPTEKRRWTTTSCGACEHFIGQILTVRPNELKMVCWLNGSKETHQSKKRHHVIIEDLQTTAVGVRWHCQGLIENSQETTLSQPDYLVTGDALKNLKMLNVFETCTSQIGDRHYLTVQNDDVIDTKSRWLKRQSKLFRGKEQPTTTTETNISLKPPEATMDELITENICQDLIDDEEWSTEESETSSITNSGSSGRVTPTAVTNQGKKSPALSTKVLKKKMKKERKLRPSSKVITMDVEPPKPGLPILVETLCTSSVATVVWQDGTIEKNIQSTQLYPIHHLDDQEFFPGDFVIKNNSLINDGQQDLRDYGVIQYMNHVARTAVVKWFRTYAAVSTADCDSSSPTLHAETEVSVYDLKDHPDFNFRPGTVVIKVAGCANVQSAAGQVLDNFPEGRICVKWVDGSQSMCWPQDLYRVGDYDSDEGELWDDEDDEDDDEQANSLDVAHDASWETQSEDSVPGDVDVTNTDIALRYRLAANIERSCDAMARLEEMFTQNPALQGRDVMRKLLDVYKDCRYLDRLMGTSIFHEQHFTALLERAKARDSRSTVTQRIQRHFQRLFSSEETTPPTSPGNPPNERIIETFSGQTDTDLEIARSNYSDEVLTLGNRSENLIINSEKIAKKQIEAEQFIRENMENWKCGSDSTIMPIAKTAEILSNIVNVQDTIKVAFEKEKDQLNENPKKDVALTSKPGEMSVRITKETGDKTVKTLYLRDSASITNKSFSTITSPQSTSSNQNCDQTLSNCNAGKALCTLIKSRLIIAHAEVLKRLGTADFIHALRNEPEEENINNSKEAIIKSPIEVEPSMNLMNNIEEVNNVSKPEQNVDEGFMVMENAPTSHKYHLSVVQPPESQTWIRAVRREFRLLGRALPPGVWVRGYEDRLDILSVMIRGPADTPYEDGLFLFDIQLGANYPISPPLFHYISYCSDRLNPNLYEDGKVCVSLLGTWSGRGSEIWGPESTLLQVIVSIQGLILNSEPYYNEAGYERQKGSALGKENSRMYNEMATLKLVQSMTKLLQSPPEVFKKEIHSHFKSRGLALYDRLENLLVGTDEHNEMKKSCSQVNIGTSTNNCSTACDETFDNLKSGTKICEEIVNNVTNNACNISCNNNKLEHCSKTTNEKHYKEPAFPLIPASKGFCLSLRTALPIFKEVLKKLELIPTTVQSS